MAGEAVRIAPAVLRLTAPNPSIMTGPGTNTYLVGERELIVVDPGPDDAAHRGTLLQVAGGRIRTIVVTHTHPDHAPGAAALAAATGAEVVGFDARDDFVPDRRAEDGTVVEVDGARLTALHTPGHASNHLCWLLADGGLLFSGDHLMQGSTVVVAPPDGDMAQYLDSLRRLLDLGSSLQAVAPGHGARMDDPAAAVEAVIAHRRWREEEVRRALRRAGQATVDDLLPDVYAGTAEVLLPVARMSLWAHLRKLAADGAAAGDDPQRVDTSWRAL